MKKEAIKNLLIPHRKELSTKWWHRLINVLIYGSTLIFFIYVLLGLIEITDLKKYEYTAYNFEANYSESKGEEKDCNFFISSTYSPRPMIFCGDIINSTDFLKRYTEARGTTEILDNLKKDKPNLSDDEILSEKIKSDGLYVKVKEITTTDYLGISKALGLLIFLTFLWFILFESIIYRAILYIIYGKNN